MLLNINYILYFVWIVFIKHAVCQGLSQQLLEVFEATMYARILQAQSAQIHMNEGVICKLQRNMSIQRPYEMT